MSDLPHTEHLSDEPFTIKPCSIQDLNGSALLSHHLLHKNKTTKSLAGTKVYDRAGIAPPLDLPNFNPFGRLFGIIFQDSDGHSRTRTISPYEYCHCWGLDPNLIVSLSEGVHNLQLLDAALPDNTSHAIIEAVLSKLTDLKFRHIIGYDIAKPARKINNMLPAYLLILKNLSLSLP